MAAYPKHYYRLQGYVDPETYQVLFNNRYPAWGTQTRIIKALMGALARHVTIHCDPQLPVYEREQELQYILDGVTFAVPRRPRGQRDGQPAATRAPQQHPSEADSKASPATPELIGGECAAAEAKGTKDQEEAQAAR